MTTRYSAAIRRLRSGVKSKPLPAIDANTKAAITAAFDRIDGTTSLQRQARWRKLRFMPNVTLQQQTEVLQRSVATLIADIDKVNADLVELELLLGRLSRLTRDLTMPRVARIKDQISELKKDLV